MKNIDWHFKTTEEQAKQIPEIQNLMKLQSSLTTEQIDKICQIAKAEQGTFELIQLHYNCKKELLETEKAILQSLLEIEKFEDELLLSK